VAGFRSRTASHRASDADRRKRDGGRLSAAGEGVVLARPVEEEHAMVLAFFAGGRAQPWRFALGGNQRTVQRALDLFAAAGQGAVVWSPRALAVR
jgi:hypothetical protein